MSNKKKIVYLTDTKQRKKELFTPGDSQSVKLYVCGVTPYDYSHIGHGRCYVSFDILARLLTHAGYTVESVRNYTDIDDKLLQKTESLEQVKQVSSQYIKSYEEDMDKLGVLPPDYSPKVTEHIEDIINFIQGLLDKDMAYQAGDDIYFASDSFESYGSLSGKNLEQLQEGARVSIDTNKKSPRDFVLWKGNSNNQFWSAPWGYGRPGWHIECSAFVKKYLGETIDIHGGGQDLLFPHHENERAQSESLTGKQFARYWVHNAHVTIKKEKMSKSLGNSFTLRDIFKQIDPMVLRFYFLQHHYRTPLDFSVEQVRSVKSAYEKLIALAQSVSKDNFGENQEINSHELLNEIERALCDDLNTPKAIGIIFGNYKVIKNNSALCASVISLVKSVLGLSCQPLDTKKQELSLTPEIEALIAERAKARENKDWARADALRDQLAALGYTAGDKKAS